MTSNDKKYSQVDERSVLRSFRLALRDAETTGSICSILARFELEENDALGATLYDQVIQEKIRLAALEAASAAYRKREGDAKPPWAQTERRLAKRWYLNTPISLLAELELLADLEKMIEPLRMSNIERFGTVPEKSLMNKSAKDFNIDKATEMWFQLYEMRRSNARNQRGMGVVSAHYELEAERFASLEEAKQFASLFGTYFIPIGRAIRTLQSEYLTSLKNHADSLFELQEQLLKAVYKNHEENHLSEANNVTVNDFYLETLTRTLDAIIGDEQKLFKTLNENNQLLLVGDETHTGAIIDMCQDSITVPLCLQEQRWLPSDLASCGRALAKLTYWRNRQGPYSYEVNPLVEAVVGGAMRYVTLEQYTAFYGDASDMICDLDLSFMVISLLEAMALSEFELWLDENFVDYSMWLETWRQIRTKWLPLDTPSLDDTELTLLLLTSRLANKPGAICLRPLAFASVMAHTPFAKKRNSLARCIHELLVLPTDMPVKERFQKATMPLALNELLIRRASYAVAARLEL